MFHMAFSDTRRAVITSNDGGWLLGQRVSNRPDEIISTASSRSRRRR